MKLHHHHPPIPNCVLSNPQPHCLQLTVDFMSGTSISPLALFLAARRSPSFRVAHKLVSFWFSDMVEDPGKHQIK